MRDCGGPVQRDTDPPPGWSWLSPEQQERRAHGGCPRCLGEATLIATPTGARRVDALRTGDAIWTLDATGARVLAHVERVGSMPITGTHHLRRVRLSDGRTVAASGPHPDATGRALSAIGVGDAIDGATVVTIEDVPYTGARTWDLLPSGPTGVYFADGVPLQSTLR